MTDFVAYHSGLDDPDSWNLSQDGELIANEGEYLSGVKLLCYLIDKLKPGDTFAWELE